eukprot:2843396-Amphidinium_carterae.1
MTTTYNSCVVCVAVSRGESSPTSTTITGRKAAQDTFSPFEKTVNFAFRAQGCIPVRTTEAESKDPVRASYLPTTSQFVSKHMYVLEES